MSAETKAVVERFWNEVCNKRNLAIVDEWLPDNVIIHNLGAIVEGWSQPDTLGLRQQLGLVPTPGRER